MKTAGFQIKKKNSHGEEGLHVGACCVFGSSLNDWVAIEAGAE